VEAFLRQLAGLDHGLPAVDRAFLRHLHDLARRRELPDARRPEVEDAVARRAAALERAELPTVTEVARRAPATLAWAAALPELLPPPFRIDGAVCDHGRAAALTAARIAWLAHEDPVPAFLAGLLHDVGRSYLEGLAASVEPSRRPRPATLGQVADGLHPTLGAALLERWALPLEAQLAVEHHHRPGPAVPPPLRRLVRVLRAADLFAGLLLSPSPALDAGPRARELERHMRALHLAPDFGLLDGLQIELDAWRALDP
jgi:hypothetical protein